MVANLSLLGAIPLSSSCSACYPSLENRATLVASTSPEAIKRVMETSLYLIVPASKANLDTYVCSLHEDTADSLQNRLNKIHHLYIKLFPGSRPLNTEIEHYRLLPIGDIEPALVKAQQLYEAYRQVCVEESLSKMPFYLVEKHSFKVEELAILTAIFSQTSDEYKSQVLERKFDMQHQLCSWRVIHYALGIPPSHPGSWIFSVLAFGFSKPMSEEV